MGLKDAARLFPLFDCVHHALLVCGSTQRAASVSALWIDTLLSFLRCVVKYPVREMGLDLLKEAIKRVNVFKDTSYAMRPMSAYQSRSMLTQDLSAYLKSTHTLTEIAEVFFSEKCGPPPRPIQRLYS